MFLPALLCAWFAALPEPGELQARIDSVLFEAAQGARIEIDHSPLAQVAPPAGADGWELSRRTRGMPGGSDSFVLQWTQGGRNLSKRTLILRVKRFETVATACKDLVRGQFLGAEDICPKEMTAVGVAVQALRAKAVPGWRLRRSVEAGHVFVTGELEAPPLALKGSAVTLVVTVGNARVEMPGTLLEDAFPERLVRVRNGMGKELQGSMDEPGRVTVTPGNAEPSPQRGRI